MCEIETGKIIIALIISVSGLCVILGLVAVLRDPTQAAAAAETKRHAEALLQEAAATLVGSHTRNAMNITK